jgi:DNA-binding transcriptional MocR family regulator
LAQATSLHAGGLAQGLAAGLLDAWAAAHAAGGGVAPAWAAHAARVAATYRERRDNFVAACGEHLPGLATWTVPAAGMFCWLDLRPSGVVDSGPLVRETLARDAKVRGSSNCQGATSCASGLVFSARRFYRKRTWCWEIRVSFSSFSSSSSSSSPSSPSSS